MVENMRLFGDKYECTCGSNFVWRYIKLDAGEAFFSRIEERMLNFKNYYETEYQRIIEIECPYCNKRHFVEFDK